MTTSANVVEYRILKDGKEIGYFRKNILCKLPPFSDLLKYEPLKKHEIQAFGYDEDEEYWERKVKNLESFLKELIPIDNKIREYFINVGNNDIRK